jgi:signal peptidase I
MRLPLRRASRAALAAVAFGASFLLGARAWRRRWLTVEVAGDSMSPALEAGDWLVIRRGVPASGGLAAGSIALARDASDRLLLKRVIGLPGETIELRDGGVHVDGRPLLEPYARGETDPSSEFRTLTRLDTGAYYLLGDNRTHSTDSRDHGAFRAGLEKRSIEGVAVLRYWPPRRLGRLRPVPRTFVESEGPGGHGEAP